MDHTLNPLASSELQRALAFARARESYPGIPGELLLELCDAAWDRAAGDAGDGGAVDRFERAMQLVARGYRVGGGRISVAEVAEQAIPRAALRRYVRPANARPAPVEEEAPMRERRPFSERLARIPMARPAPVGASVAAGLFGFVAAAQAGVLPAGPLGFAGVGDDGSSSHVRPQGDHAQRSSKRAGAPITLGQAASPPASNGPASNTFAPTSGPDAAHRTGSGGKTVAHDQATTPQSSGDTVAGAPLAAQQVSSPQVVAAPAPAPAPAPVSAPAPATTPATVPAVALDTPAGDVEVDVPTEAPQPAGEQAPHGDDHGQDHSDGGDHGEPTQPVTDALTMLVGAGHGQHQDAAADQQGDGGDPPPAASEGDDDTSATPKTPVADEVDQPPAAAAPAAPTAPPAAPAPPATPAAPPAAPAAALAAPAAAPAPAVPAAPAAPAAPTAPPVG